MRLLEWSPFALADLEGILDYIGEHNPRAALDVIERIEKMADKLAYMPTGRKGRVAGTFEAVVTGLPYILCYRLLEVDRLYVDRVIHGARDWPEGGWPT